MRQLIEMYDYSFWCDNSVLNYIAAVGILRFFHKYEDIVRLFKLDKTNIMANIFFFYIMIDTYLRKFAWYLMVWRHVMYTCLTSIFQVATYIIIHKVWSEGRHTLTKFTFKFAADLKWCPVYWSMAIRGMTCPFEVKI